MHTFAPLPAAVGYPEHTVGRLMEEPIAVFLPTLTVAEATQVVRDLVAAGPRIFTYGYIVDATSVLVGVVTMRDLLLQKPDARLESFMLRDPFSLQPDMAVVDAMRKTVNKHYPSYPVCDEGGRLVGIVRGSRIFEHQAVEISAQAGSMVGVEKEERIATPFRRSLFFRHPWLQFNLLTAFVAAGVVGVFEDTIEKIVVLAVFLPVLAGQSGNTGCQALAVALRGMTLNELRSDNARKHFWKEAALGLANGALVGVTAGLGMFLYASMQGTAEPPWQLALTVFLAMMGACALSGVSGVLVPLTLKKFGADPATASSIFLTTATDVASMGFFLGIATLLFM
jgi:magnesium transporter